MHRNPRKLEKPLVDLGSKIIDTVWTCFMEILPKLRPALKPLEFAHSHSLDSFVKLIRFVDYETTWSDVVRQEMGLSLYASKMVIFSKIQCRRGDFRVLRIQTFTEDDKAKLAKEIWVLFTEAVDFAAMFGHNANDLSSEKPKSKRKGFIKPGQTVYDPNLSPGEWNELDAEDVVIEEEPRLWFESMKSI